MSEITRERLELLGTTFAPQHSDARVLEELLYKWTHSRGDIAAALADQYARVFASGRPVSEGDIARDVHRLFVGNFAQWTRRAEGVKA